MVASSLSSLITLLIALVLFNKFGIENDILKKNLEAVSKVFVALNKVSFRIECNGGVIFYHSILQDAREGRLVSQDISWPDRIILGNLRLLDDLNGELISLGESIYMPKSIAVCIRKLYVGNTAKPKDDNNNPKKYVVIKVRGGVKKTVFSLDLGKEIEDSAP